MPATALRLIAEHRAPAPSVAAKVSSFLHGFSVEALRPNAADLAALKSALPPGSQVYLPSLSGRPLSDLMAAATRIRAQGFEPVPHLAARSFAGRDELDDAVSRLVTWAGVRRVLAVGGDNECAEGAFGASIDLIESGVLQRNGIGEVSIAGYPDGHARFSQDTLMQALAAKIEAAELTGLRASIVTQFSFEPGAILQWVRRLRDLGIDNPVRIGMAGPADHGTLLRTARRCGVPASALALARQGGLTKRLLGVGAPDRIVRTLADANTTGELGRVSAHFFSFGGAAATARWTTAAAAGRIVLDRGDGFGVEP